MRTVFLGTSDFAVTILRQLVDSSHAPTLVVTRPDRPRGRGRKLTPPPVADAARDLGIELYQPDSVNSEEAVARIGATRPEALCLCAFGALIKEPLLSDHVIFNVHPSLLPRWRGAAPVERAIMVGDAATGATIMRLTAGLDSGPICAQEAEPITGQDTYGTLAPRLAELGGRLMIESLSGEVHWTEQDDAFATYAEKIEAADRQLDPVGRSADELERVVRALDPHIGAFVAARPRRHPARRASGGRRRCVARLAAGAIVARRAGAGARLRIGRARAARRPATRPPRDERRGLPARSAPVSPARRCAYRVIRRVFEEGAYADRGAPRRGRRALAARPGAGDDARLRNRPAAGDA